MDDSQPWWLWPNLLSLDAPAVAVVWQSFLAAEEGVVVPVAAMVALALTVWGIYLADRWLDVRNGSHGNTARHRFASRNQWSVVGLASVVLIMACTIAVVGLPGRYLKVGGTVAVFLLGYFAVVHILARRASFKGLKETSVGVVFAIGVAIPLMVGPAPIRLEWVSGVIAFGGLCVMNCILISRWEESPALAPSSWIVLAASGVAVAASFAAKAPVTGAVLASLALLASLVLLQERIATRTLRVLADAVLLSPLIVTVFT